MILCYRL